MQVFLKMRVNSVLNKERVARGLLTLVFIALFIPYIAGITLERQLIGAGLFLVFGLIMLPLMFHQRAGSILRSLLNPRFVLIALILPIVPSIVAASSGQWDAVAYALLMACVLAACQLFLATLSLPGILRAFALSGVVAVPLLLLSDITGLLHSILTATRLLPPQMQPNALGFMFAGYIPVFAWKVADKSARIFVRILYLSLMVAAAAMIFLASSRASMLALVCALIWLFMMWIFRALQGKARIVRSLVLGAVIIMAAGGVTVAAKPTLAEHGMTYALKVLQLENSYRGFGSGFSGRLERWHATLTTMYQKDYWLTGAGYRTSTAEMGFSVDNGYLVVIFEAGMLGLMVIVGQLLWCFGLATRGYMRSSSLLERRNFLILGALLVVILVNNFFDRYLFGIGNPFSLVGLLFLLMSRKSFSEFIESFHPHPHEMTL